MKVCSKCKVNQPVTAFTIDRGRRDGLKPWCRTCSSAAARIRLERGPQESPPTAQACTKCGVNKPSAQFYSRKDSLNGLRRDCIDCVQQQHAVYYEANEATVREHQRQWRAEHREESRARTRLWNEDHPGAAQERVRLWRIDNRDRHNDSNSKRRALQSGATVEPVERSVVLERDEGICGLCGLLAHPDNWHLDHIIPLTRSGEHTYLNTRVSHSDCNSWKHNRLDSELPPMPERVLAKARAEAQAAQAQAA